MSFCGNCGASLEEGKKFCGACGTPVDDEPIVETEPAAEAIPAVIHRTPKVVNSSLFILLLSRTFTKKDLCFLCF